MADPIRIVILGGGFAGTAVARRLEQLFHRDVGVEITLLDRENFFLFTPLLAEVPSGSIEAKHIVTPLRACLRRVAFRQAEVHIVDLKEKVVTAAHCPTCRFYPLEFDHLVLALGGVTNFYGLPGVAEHALTLKTLGDAITLHNHIIDKFEHADMEEDPKLRRRLLTFVVAGGGFAGVEEMAELSDFAKGIKNYYTNIHPEEVRLLLVHPGPRLLPEVDEGLASYALKKLRRKGVEVRLATAVAAASAEEVVLQGGEKTPTRTLIWTAGIAPNPLLKSLPCPKDERGRIVVDESLEVPGYPGVWALGDCAHIPDPRTGLPYPPTAQHAVREGKVVAQNIAASIRGGPKQPFRYSPLGVLAGLGRRSAVAEVIGFKFSGFFAWWLWRTIYLFKLPGFERKIRVALDWTLDLFFPRDIVSLRAFMKPAVPQEAPDDGPVPGRARQTG